MSKLADVLNNERDTNAEKQSKNKNKSVDQSVQDLITGAECIVPNNADSITRAALLQQCVSPGNGSKTI